MRYLFTIPTVIAVISLVLKGCSDRGGTTCPDLELPCEEISEDARMMALCLSGELETPCALALRIERDLIGIKSIFGEQHTVLDSISFHRPWALSIIIVRFDSLTALTVMNGEYHAWDMLNDQYGVEAIDDRLTPAWPYAVL
jgi:hypothetical protein